MPITSSAKKALRQNRKRNVANNVVKDAYKKAVKSYRKLVSDKKIDEAAEQLKKTFQTLDKAAKNKVVEKNKASRLKSRLAKMLPKK